MFDEKNDFEMNYIVDWRGRRIKQDKKNSAISKLYELDEDSDEEKINTGLGEESADAESSEPGSSADDLTDEESEEELEKEESTIVRLEDATPGSSFDQVSSYGVLATGRSEYLCILRAEICVLWHAPFQ